MKIQVNIDDETLEVERTDYVRAKTKQLREFGYSHVTEEQVSEQLDAVLAKKK